MRSIFSYDYPAIGRNSLTHTKNVVLARCRHRANVIRHHRKIHFPHWGLVATLKALLFVPLLISFVLLLALNRIVSPEVWDRDFKDFLG